MRTKKFPERVEKQGVCATIYAPKDKSKGYTVGYHVRGKFVRKVRNSYEDAKQLALSVVERKASGELDMLTLSDRDCHVYLRALEAIKPTGRPLDLAIHEYAQATKLLGDESVLEAVKFYLVNRTRQVKTRTVQEVVTELLDNKQRNERSKLYLTDLKLRLTRFAEVFRCPIHTVEPTDIQQFLNGLKMAPRTRNNFRRAIGTLFRFAKVRGYVPATHTGILEVERASTKPTEIQVFTANELTALLASAKTDLIPALVIGAFAGLRSEEIKRLDWADIKWEDREIAIPAAISKTVIRRLPPMPDVLRLWLEPHKRPSGPVCPYRNLGNQFLKLAKAARVPWNRNGLRHSAISYQVASSTNMSEVARHAGNSPTMIQRHYLRVVNRKQADAWFAVTPDAANAWRQSQAIHPPASVPQNGHTRIVDSALVVLERDGTDDGTARSGSSRCRSGRTLAGSTLEGRGRGVLPSHQTNDNRLGKQEGTAMHQAFSANSAVPSERRQRVG